MASVAVTQPSSDTFVLRVEVSRVGLVAGTAVVLGCAGFGLVRWWRATRAARTERCTTGSPADGSTASGACPHSDNSSDAEDVGAAGSVARVRTGGAAGAAAAHSGTANSGHTAATSGDEFKAWGARTLDWIVQYRKDCRDQPVLSRVAPNYLRDALPASAPEQGDEWAAIMADMDRLIMPGLTHWEASNRFFAYFKPHSSFPAVLGELMCAGLNVMGFDWVASPAATELEVVTVDWLGRLLRLPPRFLFASPGPGGGVFQESAGSAATVALLAAIKRAQDAVAKAQRGGESGTEVAGIGVDAVEALAPRSSMVVYGSDQTHTIVKKACMILGVGTYRELPTRGEDNWALQPDTLRAAIEADTASGLIPVACVATAGTTSSCAFDPIGELADVCAESIGPAGPLWLHIDAAYGGAYACLPELDHLFAGVAHEAVSSFCVNCHKKLLCPFDLSVLYLSDRQPVLRALSVSPEYLRNAASESGAVVDFEHWQLPLGRRFRALKLWFVLRRFGAEAVRGHLRAGVRLRRVVEAAIRDDVLFELEPSAPPSLSLVCFRLRGADNDGQRAFLAAVKATGRCFIIHTSLGDRVVLRFACGGLEQTKEDVLGGWQVISSLAREMVTSGAIATGSS